MPTVLKHTTKSAKAEFKARGRPSLTAKEQRQLERAIELDKRAERIKQAEQRRGEAAKKRAEKEGREKEKEKEKAKFGQQDTRTAQLGSQRRCDRFGYKSSQFHLGAFFGRPRPAGGATPPQHEQMGPVQQADEDAFGDDDLDDDSLLEALQAPTNPQSQRVALEGKDGPLTTSALMPPPPLPRPRPRKIDQQAPTNDQLSQVCDSPATTRPQLEDMASFFDELESSTQIARELNESGQNDDFADAVLLLDARTTSFSSGSLDLSVEDLDALDPSKSARPPTAPPVTNTRPSMPPTVPPVNQQQKPQHSLEQPRPAATRGPFLPPSSLCCSVDLGFTSSQLETFIDDDIQLTQMAA